MKTDTPEIKADQKRLVIARRLYEALIAQDPDRQITLCDGSGRVLARNDRAQLARFEMVELATATLGD